MWSLEVVLYLMVTVSLLFEKENFWELQQQILKGKYNISFYLSFEKEIS